MDKQMILGSLQPCKQIPDKRGLLTDITFSQACIDVGTLGSPLSITNTQQCSTLLNDTHRLPHAPD